MTVNTQTGETTTEPIPDSAPTDPAELMQQLMHDCAECRALRARGETPIVIGPEEMRSVSRVFRRRPRWRNLKRRVRR